MPTPPAPAPVTKRTLYDILGVERDGNAIDIGIAYKAKMEALRRTPGTDPNEINLVHEAYHILCLPDERAAYDTKLVTMAEKAAAKEAAQNLDLDLVLEPGEAESLATWKNKYVLTAGALALAFFAFWLARSPSMPKPATVTEGERRADAAPPAPPAPATPVLNAKSAQELLAELSPSTARITVHDVSGRAVGQGSGVVIGAGTVITNCHVAAAGGSVSVKVGREQFSASVEVADEEYDLCRLSVTGLDSPAVTIGTASSLRTGQKVYAIGSPQGLEFSINEGVVSGMHDLPQGRVIQTTAPVPPGSSGGPLFDAYGRLVGIMTFQHRAGRNLSFAVPADWIAGVRSRSATHPLIESMSKAMAPN